MKSTLEDSCKFYVGKPYNDKRWIAIVDEPTGEDILNVCKMLKFDGVLLDFYKYREKIWNLSDYKIVEFIIGLDMKEIVKKLYYTIGDHIYGMSITRGKVNFRHYRFLENYPKPQITKLVGEKDTIFEIISDYKPEYKDFFHGKPWLCAEERKSSEIQSLFQAEPDCYHISMRKDWLRCKSTDYPDDFKFEIGENSKLIKKILKSHNCNIEGIDKWIAKNNNRIINVLSLSKNSVTMYYDRINKE